LLPPATVLASSMLGAKLTPRIGRQKLAGIEPTFGHAPSKNRLQLPNELGKGGTAVVP
jgi:hypothetical protein